jgi:CO/xanthine dehydrogenase Mo-binding subunit
MTEMLNKEFSRKSFVKGGGAMIVGFSVLGAGLTGKAQAADSPYASNGPYDQFQIDSWITINADNTASIKTGGVRQGTGSDTGLLMIAAEELEMEVSQLIFVTDDTNVTPQTSAKVASNTITTAGPGVRAAAAHARLALLDLASTQLGVPTASLSVSKGVVSGAGKSVSYGDLLGGKLFNVRMPASYNMTPLFQGPGGFRGGIPTGQSPAKRPAEYKVVGKWGVPRIDLPAIVTGSEPYIQGIRIPGMLHGRVVRPRGQALYGFGAPVVSVDEGSIKHIPGARVVRIKDFLGVVAPSEYGSIQAAAQLKVKWADPPRALPSHANEAQGLRALDSAGKTIQLYQANTGNVNAALASAAHVVSASYHWATNVHTPIGASCAIADVTPNGVRIFSGTQGSYLTREIVAAGLGIRQNQVRVTAVAMGGCLGPGMQYSDTAVAAALMSREVGAPVRVQLMRWDEIGWDKNAPGSLFDIRAGIDANGNVVAFEETHFYPQYRYYDSSIVIPGTSTRLPGHESQYYVPGKDYLASMIETSAELTGAPIGPTAIQGAFGSATIPAYNIPNNRRLLKSLPLKDNWFRADWYRNGSTPHSSFAGEQVIDELAYKAKMDPVAFRIKNVTAGALRDSMLAGLDAVTSAAKWQPRVSASNLSNDTVVRGRGIAWGTSGTGVTAIADIEVNKKTGKITVEHVYEAFSAGLSIYPDGVESQIVGGVVNILSRLLTEQLHYTEKNVTSVDFVSYPMLRFKDSPKVTPILLQQPGVQPTGVGEPVTTVAAAAVANAFFDATGVPMRTAPFTPARVRAALQAAAIA